MTECTSASVPMLFPATTRQTVSLVPRLSQRVFGSPSARRAHGGAEISVPLPRFIRRRWEADRAHRPVYLLDKPKPDGSLPRIWITEPAFDGKTGYRVGRDLVGCYPDGPDPDGTIAYGLAEAYFGEGFSHGSQEDGTLRRDCFCAAEILYLHALHRGYVPACGRLGIIYAYDLGNGGYWKDEVTRKARHASIKPVSARARACFGYAAMRGHAESCWRMGDLLLEDGLPDQALSLYVRAFQLAGDSSAHRGVAALRLAFFHEQGVIYPQSFEHAQAWYRLAEHLLSRAFDDGAWHFKRELHRARVGLKRMRQEI